MVKNSLLVIGAIWVEPNSSAAGVRMLQIITLFLQQKYKVVFACPSQKNAKAIDLNHLGVKEVFIELNNASFDRFITNLQPTIVLFDRFIMEEQFGWRVVENSPKTLRILDTEDLHFLRKTREKAIKRKTVFKMADLLKSTIAKREIASILRCDLSLIISTFEMDLLKKIFKIDENYLKKWKTFEERNHFIFIGNFLHKPNVDAVLTLKKHLWKEIKKALPKAELHIYGAYITQEISQLNNKKEGFIVKGFTENSQKMVENAKVVLAPLRFGAGIKGKLTEAMICGTPSITTNIGAEGMHPNLPWNGFVVNDYNEFINKAVEIFTHKNIWKKAQKNGIEIINQIYDKQKNELLFIKKIEKIKQNLETHRTQNFLGSLLQYQTLQATKYMSKWIEAKNNKLI